jgi:hypothetical protein
MNPLTNYNSVLEIVFALNAMTYLFSIEPRRRGELLGLFGKFRERVPDFDRTDRNTIRGYLILAHYGTVHLVVTTSSLVFALAAAGLMLYAAAQPTSLVETQWMVPAVIVMLTLVPFGSIWLTFVCRSRFEQYIAEFST